MPNKDYELESLSDGISHMPRRLTARERLADHVFFYLQITAWFAFILGGTSPPALHLVSSSRREETHSSLQLESAPRNVDSG